jgi:putative transposase
MKRSRFSDEQISYTLRQAENGTAVSDVCRELGISDATCQPVRQPSPVWKAV